MKDRSKEQQAKMPRPDKKVGRFYISREMIELEPAIALAVLKGVIVVRAEAMFVKDEIDYIGYSDHFIPVPHGTHVPRYEYVIEELSPATDTEPAEYHVIWELKDPSPWMNYATSATKSSSGGRSSSPTDQSPPSND